jgi:predicted transcriptional regulator
MPKRRDGIMTVRIPSDEKDQLQAIADKADVTLSDVVVRAVRCFIEDNPIPAKAKKKSNS